MRFTSQLLHLDTFEKDLQDALLIGYPIAKGKRYSSTIIV